MIFKIKSAVWRSHLHKRTVCWLFGRVTTFISSAGCMHLDFAANGVTLPVSIFHRTEPPPPSDCYIMHYRTDSRNRAIINQTLFSHPKFHWQKNFLWSLNLKRALSRESRVHRHKFLIQRTNTIKNGLFQNRDAAVSGESKTDGDFFPPVAIHLCCAETKAAGVFAPRIRAFRHWAAIVFAAG